MNKVFVVSLGCDKNRIDTENMLYVLGQNGFCLTDDAAAAQVIIINTCAFLNSAREEAIDTILDYAQYKESGECRRLIVTGCLPQLYKEELKEGLPEVDTYLGIGDYEAIASVARQKDGAEPPKSTTEPCCQSSPQQGAASSDRMPSQTAAQFFGRIVTTPAHYAYLRIADGCNNFCSYCLIPKIRGRYRSRSEDSLIAEAEELVRRGVRELIVVAQDTTRYGSDLGEYRITALLNRLCGIEGLELVRLMYCYPERITDELISLIASHTKMAKYIDIPLQHVSTPVLKAMNRRTDYQSTVALMQRLRTLAPEVAVRTTFITGFPNETQADFELLCDFLRRFKLDNAGFFAYSREEGTAAYSMDGQIDEEVKAARRDELYRIQRGISLERNRSRIGKTLRVRYEGIDYDKQMFFGRGDMHAPEIDGLIYFTAKSVEIGQFYDIMITRADDYDMFGEERKRG